MLFSGNPVLLADIWPYIECWSFNFDGFLNHSSSTAPLDQAYFPDDENYILLSDLVLARGPCFATVNADSSRAVGMSERRCHRRQRFHGS